MKDKHSLGLSVADFFWSGCVVAPLVVTYWRGTWDLLEDWVYPSPANDTIQVRQLRQTEETEEGDEDKTKSLISLYGQLTGITCYLLGLFIRTGLDLSKYHLKELVEGRTRWVRATVSWVYVALYAIAGVSFWRGIWTLMTKDIGLGPAQLLVIMVMGLVLILSMRAGKSLLSTPLVIAVDRHENIWANGNFFKKTPTDKWWFVLDVLFTNLVMRHLIVFSWWSLWELENQFLTQKDIGEKDTYVAVDSLLMGYCAYIVTYGLDYLHQNTTTTKIYVNKTLYVFTILFGLFATVNIWRGLWSMLDHFFLPDIDHDENYLLSHIVSLVLLTLAMVSTTISNDGIILDTETDTIISQRYWERLNSNKENPDEMMPIVE